MTGLPQWIRPQLTQLVDAAPEGAEWLHEHKRRLLHACMARPRRGQAANAHRARLGVQISSDSRRRGDLPARQTYLDGELCGVGPDGITSFSIIQLASDSGNVAALVFFLFDLL
jgi:bifunctional non-homologous end joining protein LigD